MTGKAPSPRKRHTLAVLRLPTPLKQSNSQKRLKKGALGLVMNMRVQEKAAPVKHVGYSLAALGAPSGAPSGGGAMMTTEMLRASAVDACGATTRFCSSR